MNKSILCVLLAVISSLSLSAATFTFYTDRAAWEATLGYHVTEEFTGGTVHTPGLSYVSTAGAPSGDLFADRVVAGSASTKWTLPIWALGFGGDWDLTPAGPGQGIQFVVNGVTLAVEIPNDYAGGFWGFISDTAFTSVYYTGGTQAGVAETYNLDNLSFGDGIPEPGTWSLLAAGALGLAFLRRRG